MRESHIKTAGQMIQDCEALQKLESLTADNWHDMAEADARLVAAQLSNAGALSGVQREAVVRAADRLLMYACWSRSYNLAVMTLTKRP